MLHREMIHRFFDNLVLNAIDFVRPEGASRWPLRRKEQARAGGPQHGRASAGRCARPVVPEGVVRRGFRQKQNLGLGLYLCRLVAVAHDGSIALREETGWATSFVAPVPVEARRVPSIWSRRSAALGPLEQRDHLGELCIRSAPRLADAISQSSCSDR